MVSNNVCVFIFGALVCISSFSRVASLKFYQFIDLVKELTSGYSDSLHGFYISYLYSNLNIFVSALHVVVS